MIVDVFCSHPQRGCGRCPAAPRGAGVSAFQAPLRFQACAAATPTSTRGSSSTVSYASAGLSLRAHPGSFVREELCAEGVTLNGQVADERVCPDKRRVTVAGLVLVRQRPGTASGVVFMTIEDESGIANLVVWPQVFERFRATVRHASAIICTGQVQRVGEVVHVVARQLRPLDLRALSGVRSRDFH